MKRLFSLIIVTAIGFAAPAKLPAAEKKSTTEKAADVTKKAGEKPVAAAKEAPAKVVGEGKAVTMHARVDAIDASAKTFTMKRKDGVEVTHFVTESTTIMNGESPAKLEDIKVGEYVDGLRRKKGENEYDVVKITKFGAAPAKKPKPDAAKPAE